MPTTSTAPAPATTAADGYPVLRLVPIPVSEPPYDDELPPRAGLVTGLPEPIGPLRLLQPLPVRAVPAPLPEHPVALPVDEDRDGPGRTLSADLPPVRPVAQALVQGLVEVLTGLRPLGQLQRGTTPELFTRLQADLPPHPRAGARPRPGALRSLHVQLRPEGVAEVCATVLRDGRPSALALRLEGLGGRWTCTDVAGLTR